MDPVQQLQETCDKLGTAVKEMRDELDKKVGAAVKDALAEAKIAKIQQTIDDLSGTKEALEKRIKAGEQVEAKVAELEAKLKTETANREEVERKLNLIRVSGAGDAERKHELKTKVNLWARGVVNALTVGVPNLTADQRKLFEEINAEYKAMAISDDTTGGYLAVPEYVREIIKGVTDVSPMREIVRVRTTANRSIMLPKRTGQFAARRTSEQGTRSETDGLRYGMAEIPAPEMYALIDISQQNLEDSAFDLDAEIREESVEQFAVKEGAEVISGTGVDQCEGILTNSSVGENNSGSAATIADASGQANGLITLAHAVKTQYARNGRWILNRVTLGSVRKLKDVNNNYVWQPGLAQGVPNTILDHPYTECPDMPNEAANAYPIAFGDFMRAYTLVDRIAMAMLRDPYTQATSGNIRFLFRRRVGGAVVLAEAVRKLKCAA